MKKMILSLLLVSISMYGTAKTWTVLSSGMTFSPETVTINQGDSVKFILDASHNAVEVSESVWDANGFTAANGGFSIPFSGGTALPAKLTVGTHYYVCSPHAAFGMKGTVVVQAASALEQTDNEIPFMTYPNPVAGELKVQLNLARPTKVELSLYDLQGKMVIQLLPPTPMIGSSTQTFDLSGEMAAGVYLIRMNANGTSSSHKVVVL